MATQIRLGAAVVGLAAAAVASPAEPPSDSSPSRSVEGSWVRLDLAGSGSFDHLTSHIEPAELTAEGLARAARGGGRRGLLTGDGQPHAAGVPYIAVARPCSNPPGRINGALLLNPDSGGVHFVAHRDQVVFAGERGGVRYIHTDGRPHPLNWSPTPAGHSVGHYEGDVLVVETVGMMNGSVPAGGQRTPETKLTERFEVSEDGSRLTITYTWEDPRLYLRPHTYQYFMERLPPGSYALEEWCDASDPVEQQSIVPPEQIQ